MYYIYTFEESHFYWGVGVGLALGLIVSMSVCKFYNIAYNPRSIQVTAFQYGIHILGAKLIKTTL